jgi:hypothetical protein
MLATILYCLLSWCNVAPLDTARHNELAELAADVAATDATGASAAAPTAASGPRRARSCSWPYPLVLHKRLHGAQ